jgi:hypothetical protein
MHKVTNEHSEEGSNYIWENRIKQVLALKDKNGKASGQARRMAFQAQETI